MLAAPASPRKSLWRYVFKLLRLRWVITASSFRRASLRSKIGTIVLGLLLVSGLAFTFIMSWLLLCFLRSPELAQAIGDITPLLTSVPVLVVSGAFIGILVTSFGLLLQALYLAGDMEFLLSTPTPIRAVFVAKLIQAVLPNFGLILLFGLPVLYGLGASADYHAVYYPLVLVVLSFLALAAAGLASLLVMAIVRIFPPRRVAEVLGFFAAIFIFTFSQSGQIVNYANLSGEQAMQAYNLLSRIDTSWSPLAWAGRSLVALGQGQWLTGSGLLLLVLVLCGVIFAGSLATAERLYYSGWARVQVSVVPKRAHRTVRPATTISTLDRLTSQALPAAVRAIVAKDFLMLRRDLRNMSGLVMPLIIGIIYSFMLVRSGGEPPPGRGEAPAWFMDTFRTLMVYGNIGISLFVGWSLLSRLAAMGFSMEGKNYWILKAAPVSTAKLLGAKFLVAYLPTLAMGWGFLVIISLVQGSDLPTAAFSLVVVALTFSGLAGLNLAFGVRGANFDWEDPRRISQGSAGCLGALASMLYLGLNLSLYFSPLLLAGVLGQANWLGQLAGLVLGGGASLTAGLLPLWLVRKRVARLMEA